MTGEKEFDGIRVRSTEYSIIKGLLYCTLLHTTALHCTSPRFACLLAYFSFYVCMYLEYARLVNYLRSTLGDLHGECLYSVKTIFFGN